MDTGDKQPQLSRVSVEREMPLGGDTTSDTSMYHKDSGGPSLLTTTTKPQSDLATTTEPQSDLASTTEPQSKRPSDLSAAQSELSNFAYHGLVSFHSEGHPYVDINRLIYNPVAHHLAHNAELKAAKKETLAWILPDFAFLIFNLLSLSVSSYFFLVGISILSWQSSMEMFTLPNCEALVNVENPTIEDFFYEPCRIFYNDQDNSQGEFRRSLGISFTEPQQLPVLTTGNTVKVRIFGLTLLVLEVLNLVNVVVGINACIRGYKFILIQHIALDSAIVMIEFIVCAVIAFASSCDEYQLKIIRVIMKNFIHWYNVYVNSDEPRSKEVELELDSLQRGLGCCGADSWTDYFATRYAEDKWPSMMFQPDNTEMVIPPSCCRPWWVRNIYCSHGVHHWVHPFAPVKNIQKFNERIIPDGCMVRIEGLCANLRKFMGLYGFIATAVHFGFVLIEAISALILIKKFNNLIRENKKLIRKKELRQDEEGSTVVDPSLGTDSKKKSYGSGKSVTSKLPPPTEDEIMIIKDRSNFIKFMSRVKAGQVGNWMKQAQTLVTEGHEENEEEAITAHEKKQREKELVHAKQKTKQKLKIHKDEHEEGVGDKGKERKQKKTAKGQRKPKEHPPDDEPEAPPPEPKMKVRKKKIVRPPSTTEEEVVVPEPEPPAKPKKKGRKKKNAKPPPESTSEDAQEVPAAPKKKLRKKVAKTPPPTSTEEESTVDEQEVPAAPKKKVRKKLAKTPPPTSTEEESTEVTEEEQEKPKRKRRRRRKKKRVARPPWYANW